jgi:transmembrane sensor
MKVDDELIAKYLSGDANPEEAMALHDWLEAPQNKAQFEAMEATWHKTHPSKATRKVNQEAAWRKIEPARSISWSTIGIAASIAIVIAVGGWMYSRSLNDVELLTATTNDNTNQIALADNSQVTLYKNTKIEYPKRFQKKSREVKLIAGEAFFSVEKDPGKPFIVLADFAKIKVVGTQFNVIMRDNNVEVGVDEGTVLVYTDTDSIYVRQGSTAVVKSGQPAAAEEIDVNTWAYATRKLVFKRTPMSKVIRALEKTFRCTISVSNDNIKKCEMTATFNGESVDKILHLISESLNLKLEQNGQVFTLEGEGCK